MSVLASILDTLEAIQSQAEMELKRRLSMNEIEALNQHIPLSDLLTQMQRYGFGLLKFWVITVGYPNLHCKASPNVTPPDGNCLIHAIADFMSNEVVMKRRHILSVNLSRDLQVYNMSGNNSLILRKRWVFGASQWLAGKHGSLQNLKEIFQYTDDQWTFVWSCLMHDKAWNVPQIKDKAGNILKENFGPEMLIKYIAHDIRCHIIVLIFNLR